MSKDNDNSNDSQQLQDFLSAGHSSKHFTGFNSHHPQNHPAMSYYGYPHFTDEETEAWRIYETLPMLQS